MVQHAGDEDHPAGVLDQWDYPALVVPNVKKRGRCCSTGSRVVEAGGAGAS
jgi:hypothetical protein